MSLVGAVINDGLFRKRWTFADSTDFTVCSIRCVYRAKLILGMSHGRPWNENEAGGRWALSQQL